MKPDFIGGKFPEHVRPRKRSIISMRCSIQIFLFVVALAVGVIAQDKPVLKGGITRIEARSANGFNYPYYLYIPPSFLEKGDGQGERTILVLPNNTGKNDDDLAVHEENVKRRIEANSRFISSPPPRQRRG